MSPLTLSQGRIQSLVSTDLLSQTTASNELQFVRNQDYSTGATVPAPPGGRAGLPVNNTTGLFAQCGTLVGSTVQDHSIAAWVYCNNNNDRQMLGSRAADISVAGFEWRLTTSIQYAYFGGGGLNGWYNTGKSIATSKWQHVVCTWNQAAGSAVSYVNGILGGTVATATAAITHGAASVFQWGRQSGNNIVEGYLDDMMFWSRILSAGEAAQLYQDAILGHPALLPVRDGFTVTASGAGAGGRILRSPIIDSSPIIQGMGGVA